MTNEPRETQRELQAKPAADRPIVGRPEVIQDLDVTGDDAHRIGGGNGLFTETRAGTAPTPVPLPYPT